MTGKQLMSEHRYAEAIAAFEEQLASDPHDLEALLRMGLCHLLNRSERAFVEIHRRASLLLGRLEQVPERTLRLWSRYERLFKAVTASTLIVAGSAGLAACEELTNSNHRYSGGVYVGEGEGEAEDAGTDADGAETDATSSHRYSGGVYLDAETD